jgi:hypothetical protein
MREGASDMVMIPTQCKNHQNIPNEQEVVHSTFNVHHLHQSKSIGNKS